MIEDQIEKSISKAEANINDVDRSKTNHALKGQELLKYIIPIFTNEFFLAHHKLNTLASLPNSPFISSVEISANDTEEKRTNTVIKKNFFTLIFIVYGIINSKIIK